MKTSIIVLCLAATVLARRDHGREKEDISKIAGCEDAEAFKGIKAETCCPALPEIFSKELYKGCKTPRMRGNKCAALDCVLKAADIADESGKFDSAKAKQSLLASLKNDASWPIATVVDGCVTQAPADVKAWQERMAALNRTEPENCTNPENYAIVKCVRRNLILSCPSWGTTDECGKLLTFAKACPKYPFREHHHHENCDKKEGESSEDKKEGETPEDVKTEVETQNVLKTEEKTQNDLKTEEKEDGTDKI